MSGISTLRQHKDEIAKLWKAGLTSYDIAAQYNVGQKTVLMFAGEDRDAFPYRGSNERQIVNRIMEGLKVVDLEPTEYDLSRLSAAKGVMNIGPCECRWPVADGLFCAEETIFHGSSYCSHHMERSTGRGTESERGTIRAARKIAERV